MKIYPSSFHRLFHFDETRNIRYNHCNDTSPENCTGSEGVDAV